MVVEREREIVVRLRISREADTDSQRERKRRKHHAKEEEECVLRRVWMVSVWCLCDRNKVCVVYATLHMAQFDMACLCDCDCK